MNRILIIEDEEKVSEVLKGYLEKEGYSVYCTISGLTGIDLLKSIDFQLVILDLMLPDISGEDVCKMIRQRSNVHIFILTAKGTLENRIDGLNNGADEYLVKPLSPRELTARVNALFRRISEEGSGSIFYTDGILSVCPDRRTVWLNGKPIPFTPNEFDLLVELIKRKGKVLSREQLIQAISGSDFPGDERTIDVHIKNIRKKIEIDSKNPHYIVTVLKAGYKFGGGM